MIDHFLADLHLGDAKLARARGFDSADAMTAAIVAAWTARVTPDDRVWVVGDVGDPAPLAALPGTKHLVLGNTDTPVARYRAGGIYASVVRQHVFDTPDSGAWLLVHRPQDAPIDPAQPVVHGHIHAKQWPDRRFVCVSVDQTDWGPVTLGDVAVRCHGSAMIVSAEQ